MVSEDRGFLYGDALFETLRVWPDGSVRWLARHLARFERSAESLGFRREQIREALSQLERVGSRKPGIWRMTVSRDDAQALYGGEGQISWRYREAATHRARPSLMMLRGWHWPHDPMGGFKSTSYLRQMEAARRAQLAGYDDALLLSHDGALGEASSAAVVLVVEGRALTPPLGGILRSVTRQGLLEDHAEALSLQVAPIEETLLELATEICLLSSGSGARAGADLEGRPLDDSWTRRVQALLEVVR